MSACLKLLHATSLQCVRTRQGEPTAVTNGFSTQTSDLRARTSVVRRGRRDHCSE
jgi:hypothetical protein